MIPIVRSEAIKLYSIRQTWIFAACTALVMVAVTGLYAINTANVTLSVESLFWGGDLAFIIIVFAAAMIVGTDISRKTYAWTFLSTNRRVQALGSQLLLVVATMSGAAIIGAAGGYIAILLAGKEFTFTLGAADRTAIVTQLCTWIVFGLIAATLATILGSGTYAAMIVIAEMFVVETILASIDSAPLHAVQHYLPFLNTKILGGEKWMGFDHSRLEAAIILAVTLLILVAAAIQRTRTRAVR